MYKKIIEAKQAIRVPKRKSVKGRVYVRVPKGATGKLKIVSMGVDAEALIKAREKSMSQLDVKGEEAKEQMEFFNQNIEMIAKQNTEGEFAFLAQSVLENFSRDIEKDLKDNPEETLLQLMVNRLSGYKETASKMAPQFAKGMWDAITIIERVFFKSPEDVMFEQEVEMSLNSDYDFVIMAPQQFLTDPTFFEKLSASEHFKGVIIPNFTMKTSHITIISRDKGLFVLDIENDSVKDFFTRDELIIKQKHEQSKTADIIINPNSLDIKGAERASNLASILAARKEELSTLPPRTRDGVLVKVSETVAAANDAGRPLIEKGGDVGLSRTELGFSQSDPASDVADAKRLSWLRRKSDVYISRTSDITGDKGLVTKGPSPQSIRYSLYTEKGLDLFIRDIISDLAVSGLSEISPNKYLHGSYYVMFPNVQNVQEIKDAKEIIGLCKKAMSGQNLGIEDKDLLDLINKHVSELRSLDWVPDEGKIPFDNNMHIGAMIENPWAVRDIEKIESEVRFLKLGKNDTFHYINYMVENMPYLFDFKDVEGPEGIMLKQIPVLKEDVGSKVFTSEHALEATVNDSKVSNELMIDLYDRDIINSNGAINLKQMDENIDELRSKYPYLVDVMSRLVLSVDDLPGRETSTGEDILSIIAKPRNIRYMAYLYNSFKTLPFAGSCGGEGSAVLAPIELACGQRNMTMMDSDKTNTTLYLRDLSYKESVEMLNLVVEMDDNDSQGVLEILDDRFAEFIEEFEVNSASPEYEKAAKETMQLIDLKKNDIRLYTNLLNSLTEENYIEKLRNHIEELNLDDVSLESAIYALQERVFQRLNGVSNTNTYDVRRFFNKDGSYDMYVRKLGRKNNDSRYYAEFIEGTGKTYAEVPALAKAGEIVSMISIEAEVKHDENGESYFDLSSVAPGKKLYFKEINENIYIKMDENAFHRERFDELTRKGIGKTEGTAYTQMNGTPSGTYSDHYVREQVAIGRALHGEKFLDLLEVFANSSENVDLIHKIESFLFGEKGYEEIHRENSSLYNGIPDKQVIMQISDFNRYCDLFIDALTNGDEIEFKDSESGSIDCYINGEKVKRMNENPDLKAGLDNIFAEFRNAVNDKIDQIRYNKLEKKRALLLKQMEELNSETNE